VVRPRAWEYPENTALGVGYSSFILHPSSFCWVVRRRSIKDGVVLGMKEKRKFGLSVQESG
jgi:hypothetical protein